MATPSLAIFMRLIVGMPWTPVYAPMAASFAFTAGSLSGIRWIQPSNSERSSVSTEIPIARRASRCTAPC